MVETNLYLLLHLLDLVGKLLDLLLVLLLLPLAVLEDSLPLPLHQLDFLFHLGHLLENCSPSSPSVRPCCKSLHLGLPVWSLVDGIHKQRGELTQEYYNMVKTKIRGRNGS